MYCLVVSDPPRGLSPVKPRFDLLVPRRRHVLLHALEVSDALQVGLEAWVVIRKSGENAFNFFKDFMHTKINIRHL